MPKSFKKRELGQWPDKKKHEEVLSPQRKGEIEESGHMTDPDRNDVDEMTENMGIYTKNDPNNPENPQDSSDNPTEVNIAEEVEKAEKNRS